MRTAIFTEYAGMTYRKFADRSRKVDVFRLKILRLLKKEQGRFIPALLTLLGNNNVIEKVSLRLEGLFRGSFTQSFCNKGDNLFRRNMQNCGKFIVYQFFRSL